MSTNATLPAISAKASSIGPGSSCAGLEGQWNCLGSSWQRCASGRWSVVMQCAAGTICVPQGQTYDFKVQSTLTGSGSSGQFATAGAAPSKAMGLGRTGDDGWAMLAVPVGVLVRVWML